MGILSKLVQIGLTPSAVIAKVLAPKKFKELSISEMVEQGSKTTIGKIIGGSVAVVGTAITLGKGKAIITAISKLKPLQRVGVVTAGAVIIPAVIANPDILFKAIETTADLPKAGYDIGEFSKHPTLEGAKQLIENHPEIAILTGSALIAVVGIAGAKIIALYLGARAGKNVDVDVNVPPSGNGDGLVKENGNGKAKEDKVLETVSEVPKTPTTEVVTVGDKRITKRRKIKATLGNVNQRVNILIANQNKRIIYKNRHLN